MFLPDTFHSSAEKVTSFFPSFFLFLFFLSSFVSFLLCFFTTFFLLIHIFTSWSHPPSHSYPYKSLSILSTPILLKEGDVPLGYHPILGHPVPAWLGTPSPTESQTGSPGRGNMIQWQGTKTESAPTLFVREPLWRPSCTSATNV